MSCSACARRSDYRVLFTLDVETHIVYVHRIEHRFDVYKPRQPNLKGMTCYSGASSQA
jgi:hypothetical protein